MHAGNSALEGALPFGARFCIHRGNQLISQTGLGRRQPEKAAESSSLTRIHDQHQKRCRQRNHHAAQPGRAVPISQDLSISACLSRQWAMRQLLQEAACLAVEESSANQRQKGTHLPMKVVQPSASRTSMKVRNAQIHQG